jgi:hypothetical protein
MFNSKFSTIGQVVDYYVSNKGVSLGVAKAITDQGYNFGDEYLRRDIESEIDPTERNHNVPAKADEFDNEFVPVYQTQEQLDNMYSTFMEMLTFDDKYIYIDGEPIYNLDGTFNKAWQEDVEQQADAARAQAVGNWYNYGPDK